MEIFTESFGFEASERFCGNFGAGHSFQKNVILSLRCFMFFV